MYGCVTKVSECPNQTRYAEETEPKVSMTPWSVVSSNHKQEVESQCQNQQGGYAPVWMHHLRMGKLSVQNDLWKVSVRHKLSSHKIIIMSGLCPSVSISKSNNHEKSTTNHASSDQNESLLLKVTVAMWREYLSSKEKACPNMNWYL